MSATAELPQVSGRHRNRALASARRARAVELVTEGYTYQQAADELGYSNRGTVHHLVSSALTLRTNEAVDALRELETERLDALQHALWDAAMTGDVHAATAIVRIVQTRVRLHGLGPVAGTTTASVPRTVVVPPPG